MTAYIALLRKQPRSDFGVDFPDFPGCITAGRTLDEARRMASEALLFHVDGMREDGTSIPPTGVNLKLPRGKHKVAVTAGPAAVPETR